MTKHHPAQQRRAKRVLWAKLINVLTLLVMFCAFVVTGFSDHTNYWPYILGVWVLVALGTYAMTKFSADR